MLRGNPPPQHPFFSFSFYLFSFTFQKNLKISGGGGGFEPPLKYALDSDGYNAWFRGVKSRLYGDTIGRQMSTRPYGVKR